MTKKESTKAYRISWADEYFETPSLLPGGGGYSWEFLMVCRPVLQIVTLFQIKKCNLPPLFSDQASRNHTCFQTWPLCYHYFDQSAKQKKFFKSISNSHVSISFLLIWN